MSRASFGTLTAAGLLSAAVAHASGVPEQAGVYVQVFGGWADANDQSLELQCQGGCVGGDRRVYEFDDAYLYGGAVGVGFAPGWRSEIETTYRSHDVSSAFEGVAGNERETKLRGGGSIEAWTVMANIWKDIQITDRLSCHVGGGMGIAEIQLDPNQFSLGGGATDLSSDWVFAGQVGVGIDFALTKSFALFLDYRYLMTDRPSFDGFDGGEGVGKFQAQGDNFKSNQAILGARMTFGK